MGGNVRNTYLYRAIELIINRLLLFQAKLAMQAQDAHELNHLYIMVRMGSSTTCDASCPLRNGVVVPGGEPEITLVDASPIPPIGQPIPTKWLRGHGE